MIRAVLVLALLLPGLAPPLAAATPPTTQAWAINPARSEVEFSVRKFWFTHVRGAFPGLRGSLRQMDTRPGDGLAEVNADVAVAGLAMDDARARSHALGSAFFDAPDYPAIHFDSDPFPLAELATGGVLRGMLQLHGERHPVVFTLSPSACPEQPLRCVIRVQGALSRAAFGMHAWRGVVGDKVELRLRILLEGQP